MSLILALNYPGWFTEGTAVYSANQMGVDGYFSKEETLNKIKSLGLEKQIELIK